MAHGHTWGLLPACSPKGEEHIRKLLCRNRLRGLSWKGTSQSRLFATASKQPACPQSGHEPNYPTNLAFSSPLMSVFTRKRSPEYGCFFFCSSLKAVQSESAFCSHDQTT